MFILPVLTFCVFFGLVIAHFLVLKMWGAVNILLYFYLCNLSVTMTIMIYLIFKIEGEINSLSAGFLHKMKEKCSNDRNLMKSVRACMGVRIKIWEGMFVDNGWFPQFQNQVIDKTISLVFL